MSREFILLSYLVDDDDDDDGEFKKKLYKAKSVHCSVGLDYRIRQVRLCKGVRTLLNEYHGYDPKPSGGDATVLESVEYLFIVINPRSTFTGSGSTY